MTSNLSHNKSFQQGMAEFTLPIFQRIIGMFSRQMLELVGSIDMHSP